MNILLHSCCGPCSVYPVQALRDAGHHVQAYFYNPNIHPYREFRKRLAGMRSFAEQTQLAVDYDNDYGLQDFLRQVVFQERSRCGLCYRMRLEKTAQKALELGLDGFSTTLLYSIYQNHALLIALGEEIAQAYTTQFYYQDFRPGWQEGIDGSIAMDLYRQPYCGCIYSEQERYDKKLRKKRRQQKESTA